MSSIYTTLVPVVAVAAAAPLIVGAMPARLRISQVVFLLAGGVIIGPELLNWSSPANVTLLSDLGLGFLFLLAGYELDPKVMRERAGRLAQYSWLTSLLISAAWVGVLYALGDLHAVITVSIALTTTALGVLLPILRENGLLDTTLGRQTFAAGAVGELGPIVAMALLLGSRRTGVALVLLIAFAVLAVTLAFLPGRVAMPRTTELLLRSEHGNGQSTLRITLLLLVGLLSVAASLGFDSVLGAFVAGMVLRKWSPGNIETLERKLEIVGWGVFIPIFFVSSGMGLDVDSIVKNPRLLILIVLTLLLVRGGPALFWYRRALPMRGRVQLAFFTATTLPLLVALTEIAVGAGTMTQATAAALVGAGALSVLLFPPVAIVLGRRGERSDAEGPGPADEADPGPQRAQD